jgi:hypothetical protein
MAGNRFGPTKLQSLNYPACVEPASPTARFAVSAGDMPKNGKLYKYESFDAADKAARRVYGMHNSAAVYAIAKPYGAAFRGADFPQPICVADYVRDHNGNLLAEVTMPGCAYA